MNILLGITGCRDAILIDELIKQLETIGNIRIVITKNVNKFINTSHINEIYQDNCMWNGFKKKGDSILHFELIEWADIFIIAPCSINTIAKIANGLCDNMLTNIGISWNYKKRFYIAPACSETMWTNIATRKNLTSIKSMGINIINPTEDGEMNSILKILNTIKNNE